MKALPIRHINRFLLFIILTSVTLYYGREIFIVLISSVLLAMLMTPLTNKLEKIGIPKTLSALISVILIVIVIYLIIWTFSLQFTQISQEYPKIKLKFSSIIESIHMWVKQHFGISYDKQTDAIKKQASSTVNTAGTFLFGIVSGTFSLLANFLLVIVFTFLFILQRAKYEKFVLMFYPAEKQEEAMNIIIKVSKVAQQYLFGRVISIFLLTILHIIGFLIIGLKNAVLLSATVGILTFIPYVGPILGGLFPIFIALLDSYNLAFWVIIILVISETIYIYFIEPYVVGGSVSISFFFTIFILILGGIVWGIVGVILFLPLLGIIKIICENVDGLKPYAYLIGSEKESVGPAKLLEKIKKLFSIK